MRKVRSQNNNVRILDAVAAYDAFAPYYQSYSQSRIRYLRSIDSIVIANAKGSHSLLDVGSGNGRRALRLATSIQARKLVLVEPSAGMRRECHASLEVLPCRAWEIPWIPQRFDAITCLWNVLGHIERHGERVAALARFKALLSDSGSVFLDVHHRYNAAAYGWTKTLLRMAQDHLRPRESNGDVVVRWNTGGDGIATRGHVFTESEIQHLLDEVGLTVARRWIVDYTTGEMRERTSQGNLVYQLRA
jgi:SAM-dependent methyltransferase